MMFTQGQELQHSDYDFKEIKSLNELRHGRFLMCRKVTFHDNDSPPQEITTNHDSDGTNKATNINTRSSNISNSNISSSNIIQKRIINHLLFIHGSCATSQQYNSLLHSLATLITTEQDTNKNNNMKNDSQYHCYLYDQLGCGESKHPSSDWNAFSSIEHDHDLETITTLILKEMTTTMTMQHDQQQQVEEEHAFYIIAHSYGCSQTIQLLSSLQEQTKEDKLFQQQHHEIIKGAILISGGLKDCHTTQLTNDGGHWIFNGFIPLCILNLLQSTLSQGFINAAIHPKNVMLKDESLRLSNSNDMAVCKAFYRQQRYATSEQAQCLKVS